jgi:hypothetical protein
MLKNNIMYEIIILMNEKISFAFNPYEPTFLSLVAFTLILCGRNYYRKNKDFFQFLTTYYTSYDTFFTKFNNHYYGFYHYYPGLKDESDEEFDEYEEKSTKNDKTNEKDKPNEKITKPIKYEDKYKETIQNTSKEYIFTEEEQREMGKIYQDNYNNRIIVYQNKINDLKNQIENIKQKNTLFEKISETDFIEMIEQHYDNDDDYDYYCKTGSLSKEDVTSNNNEFIKKLEDTIAGLEENKNDTESISEESLEYSKTKIIEERTNKLKGCFVMEYTPLGNVLMSYNKVRESFSYYSDNTIPYRYLEVVARKFVKTFHCRPIFVDMEQELKNYETKIKQHQEKVKEQEQEQLKQEKEQRENPEAEQKKPSKNVFAKLKNYNKPSTKISSAPPPKSSIPNQNFNSSTKNEPSLLKENANRYTYEGKITTFNMLKKVERKVVDKKYGMTFADFKNLKKL